MLEVRLIGKFDIQCDGKPVLLSSRAAQSLFAFLVLTAGTLHRREKLAGMLWPDESEQKARTYLRNELWRIRKALPQTSSVQYLLADNLTVGFNPASEYWLDIINLNNLSNTASAEELVQALSNYQSELLPGFYEDWVVLEREHLQVLFEQKVACLLEILEKEQRWQDILEWAERWISFGQAPEAAYRALMIAYDALGDHAKVASTYERCKQALRQLDLEPSEQTRALAFKRSSKIKVPIPLTSFVGREKEIKEIAGLFSKSRLITLAGSGGVGKTRLAIQVVPEVMDRFPDGVWFLDLAPLSDPALVPRKLANLLGLRESEDLPVIELLKNFLQYRIALVVFDNCEHLIEACAQLINALLNACGHLSVVATSREVLRVSGEIPYRVPSLKLPISDHILSLSDLMNSESVQLFAERAAIASPSFTINAPSAPIVAQICRRLDGIPLAIELAAARTNMLTVEQISELLDDRFNLLSRGLRSALPRHQTMRAVIDWSYSLLTDGERKLLRRLSVFAGGCTGEAANAICGDAHILDSLARLVEKSLVIAVCQSGQKSRYSLLETIRQYSQAKLKDVGEDRHFHFRHLDFFLKLAKEAEPELYGERQIDWLRILEEEHENLRAALEWSLQWDVIASQELAGALWWSWLLNGRESEGYDWLEKILLVSSGQKTRNRAKLLSGQAELAHNLGYSEKTEKLSEESIALYLELGDEVSTAFPLVTLAMNTSLQSDYDRATELASKGLDISRRAGNRWEVGRALGALSGNAKRRGDSVQAQKFLEECLVICKDIGDKDGSVFALYSMAGEMAYQGHLTRATELYEEILEIEKQLNRKFVAADVISEMAYLAIHMDDDQKSKLLLQEAIKLYQDGAGRGTVYRLLRFGWCVRLQGDLRRAQSLYAEGLHLARGNRNVVSCLIHVCHLMQAQGFSEKFARLLGAVEGAVPEIQKMLSPLFRLETDKFIRTARISLGDEPYEAAWEVGRQMSLDEAVTYALRELE